MLKISANFFKKVTFAFARMEAAHICDALHVNITFAGNVLNHGVIDQLGLMNQKVIHVMAHVIINLRYR